MKLTFFNILCLVYIGMMPARAGIACEKSPLKTDADAKKAEPCVTTAANYILAKTIQEKSQLYNDYRIFLVKWMDKTPDYLFNVNQNILLLCMEKGNEPLVGIFAACMAKSALQQKKDFERNGLTMFVEYISDAKNLVKQTSRIKKLIADHKNNQVDKYLGE